MRAEDLSAEDLERAIGFGDTLVGQSLGCTGSTDAPLRVHAEIEQAAIKRSQALGSVMGTPSSVSVWHRGCEGTTVPPVRAEAALG